MKTEISTQNFKNMLKVIEKVKSKDLLVATDLLVVSDSTKTHFVKTNGETTIKYSIPTYIEENGSITLPLETAEIIKKLKENSLVLTNDKIKTERKEINFKEQSPITINTYDNIEKIFSVTQKELLRMLGITYAVAQDDTRPILTGVCFNKNETCALDGFRMSIRKTNQYNNDRTFVVNKSSIEILKSILKDNENIVNVYHDNNNIVKFEIDDIEIIATCLEGEFIKYNSFIPQEHKYKVTLKPEDMVEEIDFIKTADSRNFLKTIFTDNKIILKGSQCKEVYNEEKSYKNQKDRQRELNEDYRTIYNQWLEKKKLAISKGKQFRTKEPSCKQAKFIKQYDFIPTNDVTSNVSSINELNGESEFAIAYNPKYMLEGLKQYKDKVEIRMTTDVSPIIITNDGENLELLLPVRFPKECK